MTLFDLIILFMAGCAGGIISGLLGVGGGIIYVAILSIFFDKLGVNDIDFVRYILSNSFFAIFFASVVGSIQQIRQKNFFIKEVILLSISSVILSFVVSFLIVQYNWYSKSIFNIFFIIVLTVLMLRMFINTGKKHQDDLKDNIRGFHYTITGIFTGAFSALSGLGGGVITVPLLADFHKLRIKKATSISLGAMPFMTVASALFYAQFKSGNGISGTFGYLYPQITIPMVLGVILTSAFGVKLSKKLTEKTIRYTFASVMLLVIIRMGYSLF